MSASVEKLEAARALIARPGGWMQGAYARDADGEKVAFFNMEEAVCWCANGAIRCCGGGYWELRQLAGVLGFSQPHQTEIWNDEPKRTQFEVVAVFDRAIELARAAS